LVVAALAASIALVAVAVVALTRQGSTRPPADVYTRLAQQLKGHLPPLVPAKAITKHAPSIQVPPLQGYSCETASTNGCSLHPCVKYAVQQVAVPAGPGVVGTPSASANRCTGAAKSTPRAIPISVP
jgi:hypothetical protein